MSPSIESLIAEAHRTIDRVAEPLVEVGKRIHAHPELGGEETLAVEALTGLALQQGMRLERGIAGLQTAFLGESPDAPADGPVVAILSEYDALPGLGHACGHNLIAIAGLGAALGAMAVAPSTGGRVLWIGTPAEENFGGKVILSDAGIFDRVDAAMMVHPDFRNEVNVKTLGMSEYVITFTGKASHAAASPDEGVNALDAMIALYNNVSLLRQQTREEARLHGIITHGGDAPNVIPARTEARWLVRAKTKPYHDRLRRQFEACVEAAAKATGCGFDCRCVLTYDPFVTNTTLGALFHAELSQLGVKAASETLESGLGSSDIGNVGRRCPTIHPLVDLGVRPTCALHTPDFERAANLEDSYRSTLRAAKAMAATAIRFLSDPEARQRAREEFESQRAAEASI